MRKTAAPFPGAAAPAYLSDSTAQRQQTHHFDVFISKTVLMQYQIIVYHFVIDTVCLFKPVLHRDESPVYLYPRQTALHVFRPQLSCKGNRPFKRNTATPFSDNRHLRQNRSIYKAFPRLHTSISHSLPLRPGRTGQMRRRSCTLPPKTYRRLFLYLQRNIRMDIFRPRLKPHSFIHLADEFFIYLFSVSGKSAVSASRKFTTSPAPV